MIRQTVLHTRRRGFELTPAPRQKPRDPSTPRPSSPAGIGSWIDGTASHSLPPHSSVSACVPTSGQHQQTTQGKPNHPPESPVLNLSRPIHPPARDKGRSRSQTAPRAGRLRALGDIYPQPRPASPPARAQCPLRTRTACLPPARATTSAVPRRRRGTAPPPLPSPHSPHHTWWGLHNNCFAGSPPPPRAPVLPLPGRRPPGTGQHVVSLQNSLLRAFSSPLLRGYLGTGPEHSEAQPVLAQASNGTGPGAAYLA